MFFFIVDTGDIGIATFNSSEKLTCKGLTYGHIQEGKNKEESVGKYTFECRQGIEGDLTVLPYHIYYPTPTA